jgi:hypothetical protein
MPSFSAIVYFFLGINRTEADETFLKTIMELASPADILGIYPAGTKMNQPIPIFTKIDDVEEFKKRFRSDNSEQQHE